MAVTITTGPTNLRIYQRSTESHRASIKVAGAYVGSGTSAHYRVTEGATVIQEWKELGAVSVSAGAYSGYMINVPSGSPGAWFTLSIRIVDAAGTVVDSTTFGSVSWSVGVDVLGCGQSLLSEWNTKGSGAVWQAGTSVADQTGAYTQPATGQGAAKFCAQLSNLIGVPVALVNLAVSGSALRKRYIIATGYWYPNDATSHTTLLAKAFHDDVDEVEFMIWCHGETDAVQANIIDDAGAKAGSDYDSAMKGLIDELYTIFGAMVIYTIPIGRTEIGIVANLEHAEVRTALDDRTHPLSRYAATHYDLTHDDANTNIYHLDGAGYEILATRCAYQIAYNQYGVTKYGRCSGPWIDKVIYPDQDAADSDIVDVYIEGARDGLSFKGGTANMTHWIAHRPDGVEEASPASAKIMGNVVRLTFNSLLTDNNPYGIVAAGAYAVPGRDIGALQSAPIREKQYLLSYCYGTGFATNWNTGGVQDNINVGDLTGIPLRTQSLPIPIEKRVL